MKLTVANTGFFKLDGGAMFGVVPKVLWSKKITPDENNLCNWALRCLLVEDGNRLILIDTGMGEKQSDKFFSYYYRSETRSIETTVNECGYGVEDVTDVFLTHLHFDHCGGAIKENVGKFSTAFPNATYWSNQNHWEWATKPNPRERASFLSENILPIEESGQLKMIDPESYSNELPFDILFMDGHTEKQMLPVINYKGEKIVFMADLLPSYAHLPLAYVMGYDVRPLQTMKEKRDFLNKAAEEDYILFFEHDAFNECARVEKTEKGVVVKETFDFSEI